MLFALNRRPQQTRRIHTCWLDCSQLPFFYRCFTLSGGRSQGLRVLRWSRPPHHQLPQDRQDRQPEGRRAERRARGHGRLRRGLVDLLTCPLLFARSVHICGLPRCASSSSSLWSPGPPFYPSAATAATAAAALPLIVLLALLRSRYWRCCGRATGATASVLLPLLRSALLPVLQWCYPLRQCCYLHCCGSGCCLCPEVDDGPLSGSRR